jgi:DNA polymerase-1
MESYGSEEPGLLVIGEAPGEDEDRQGQPFVGKSGALLRQVLEELFDVDADVRFTNVVRCRPPDNKITKMAMNHCSRFALQDILDYKPALVFLMGGSALSGVLGENGITNWHGSIIDKEVEDGYGDKFTVRFVPLYHPAYILRDSSHMDEWLEAITNAIDAEQREDCQYIYPETLAEVKAMQGYLAQHTDITFDVETSTLDPYLDGSLLLSLSFAAGSVAYSLPVDHPESWFLGNAKLKTILRDIFQSHSGHLSGHNVKFDLMHVSARLGIDVDAGGDTMLISHLLDSRQGVHGLKRLAGVHLGMYDYDSELEVYKKQHPEANPERGGSYAKIPLDILLPYGAKDSWATLQLERKLYPELSDTQKTLYHELVVAATNALRHIQSNGLPLDAYVAKRYAGIYELLRDKAFQVVLDDPKVKSMMSKVNKKLRQDSVGKKRQPKPYIFNPGSANQLRDLYFLHYKLPEVGKTKSGAPTTSSKSYRPLESKHPILYKIRYYKLLSKMLGTYLRPAAEGKWSSSDGKVRTTYNQHGTVTGRLSSSRPLNLQNIPTPEKEPGTILEHMPIKNVFTHSDWLEVFADIFGYNPWPVYDNIYDSGALVAADYSGMELRVFASLANCQPMIDIIKSGKDFHSVVAIMAMTHKSPFDVEDGEIKALPKPVRYRYKWTNWTLLYGGDAYTLHRLYDIPLEDAEETVEIYYDIFPEVLDYRKWTQSFAEDNGYIESPFGRREHLPYINDPRDRGFQNKDRRAAVNMPVQSAASDTLLTALTIIDRKLRDTGLYSKLVNTVHDSLVADSPRHEIVAYAGLCKDVMENVATYAAQYAPGLDFSWLRTPLKADIEVGTHYGAEMGLDEWLEEYGQPCDKELALELSLM